MRTRGLLFPVVLVLLGVLLLMRNLGVLDWNIGDILRTWWPALVILLGLDLLFSRRLGSAIVALIVLAALGLGAFFWIQSGAHLGWGSRTERFSMPLGDAPAAEVVLATERPWRLVLSPGRDAETLVGGKFTLGWHETLRKTTTIEASGAYVSLQARGASPPPWPFRRDGADWQIFLTPSIPLRLTVKAAGGHTSLELSPLRVVELHLALGGGEAIVELPTSTPLRGSVDAEHAHLTVRVRPPIALHLRLDGVPEKVRVPESFLATEDGWLAPDYGEATVTAELILRAQGATVIVEQER